MKRNKPNLELKIYHNNSNPVKSPGKNDDDLKIQKKYSTEYFNERKRSGFPTLTQKKRDLDNINVNVITEETIKSSENIEPNKNNIISELENTEGKLDQFNMNIKLKEEEE